jgi:hypothetical protein
MNLVDEEHIASLEIGNDGGKVAGTFQGGAAGGLEVGSHLYGKDSGQRCLAQAGRSGEQYVVYRFATLPSGLNQDGQSLFEFLLANEIVHMAGTQRHLLRLFLRKRFFHQQTFVTHMRSPLLSKLLQGST